MYLLTSRACALASSLCFMEFNLKVSLLSFQPLGDVSEVTAAILARSVHVAPFPFDSEMLKLEEFFNSKIPTNAVHCIRRKDVFTGEIFVECKDVEAAKQVKYLVF